MVMKLFRFMGICAALHMIGCEGSAAEKKPYADAGSAPYHTAITSPDAEWSANPPLRADDAAVAYDAGPGATALVDAEQLARDAGPERDAHSTDSTYADDAATAPADGSVTPARSGIPEELADLESLQILGDWRALPVLGDGITARQTSGDRYKNPNLGPILANGNADLNNFVCLGKDTVIADSQAVPLQFDLPSCPEPYVRGAVLSRFEGSGRLVRLFITQASLLFGPPDEEVLRIYVDDEREPRVEVPLARALDGSASEMFAPPFGSGVYQQLAWYYPVVFATKVITTIDHLGELDEYYHQTDVILDRVPRKRQASPVRLDARKLARMRLMGLTPLVEGLAPLELDRTLTLSPGAVERVELTGPATVYDVWLAVAEEAVSSLQSVILRIEWDNRGLYAINLPLLDLFAASAASPGTNPYALSGERIAGRQQFHLRIPMPFAKNARWTFTNTSDQTIRIDVAVLGERSLPADPWGHLFAMFSHTPGPTTLPVHPLVSVAGRGKFIGTCLTMRGHSARDFAYSYTDNPFNYLEGDDIFLIDGRELRGTGTEDLFDNSFYFSNGATTTPFSQVWNVVVDPFKSEGSVSTCRWFTLTAALNFQSSCTAAIEIGPARPDLLDDYRSVSFVYMAH
jgi:hypothetical protein